MKKQPGFMGWEINKNKDEWYTDIVSWQSEEFAKKAEKDMVNIPNANDWYSCYDRESMDCKNCELIKEFTK